MTPAHPIPYPGDAPFVLLAGPDVIEGDGTLNLEAAQALKEIVDRVSQRWPVQFYFKASYDKANRTSIDAYRGPGYEKGLPILADIKSKTGVSIITDIHNPHEIAPAAEVADMLQIPAFLSRQTDMLVTAGQSGAVINIKKGQFLSPHDVIHCAEKVKSTGNHNIYITERGSTFGYNNLVVDMRCIPIIHSYGYPLIFDATHSVQLPGGQGHASGGQREYALTLARAAAAAGCDGLFIETHPNPDAAPCDGPNMIPISWVENLLETCLSIRETIRKTPAADMTPMAVMAK